MAKKRLQFDFTQDALRELDELQKTTGAPSRAELIRHALRLLQWMVEETKEKRSTFLIERGGKVRELLLLPFLNQSNPIAQKPEHEKEETIAQP